MVEKATNSDELPSRLAPLLRDPASMRDLLSYQLVGGVTAGRELDEGL